MTSAYLEDAAAVARALGTNLETGITAREAAHRLATQGPNKLRSAPRLARWRRVLAHFQDPLVYLLIAAAAIAFAAWIIEGRPGWPVDAIVIASVVLINGALGNLQQAKAEDAVAALARMTAVTCSVKRDGKTTRIASRDVVLGDIMVLAEGDAVAADARLFDANSLRVQESSLTGESESVLKDTSALTSPAALGDRLNMVFKGTAVAQGTGHAVVTATGMKTEMGSIAEMLEATAETPTPLQKEISRVGRTLGIAVIGISIVVVTTILLISDIRGAGDVVDVLLLGVSLSVAAVPEGLPAILSLVLALGVQRMARHNAVVKKLSSVETLGSASVIASDKTGTLTRAEMTIVRVMTASGTSEISGVGYSPAGEVTSATSLGDSQTNHAIRAEQIALISGGSLAGNARLDSKDNGTWEIHGDPTEAAFLVAERKLGVRERREKRFERIAEVPFTSERKMMSTIERDREHGEQIVVITKGAPEIVLRNCTHSRLGLEVIALDDTLRKRILADVDRLTDDALRTLAVAYRPLNPAEAESIERVAGDTLEHDLIFVGTVGIIDPPRKEAAVAIAEARRAGIRVIMITGDHPRTAGRIASDLGIVEPGEAALTGRELDALDTDAFADRVRDTSVFARVSPANKLRIVAALRADGNIVAMTGDGVNDAPALKSADIGIAMGKTGTEVTKEAAKMILADDNFATIVQAVREGRAIFDNIRKFLRYLLSSNMGEVLTVFLGVVGATVIGLTGADGVLVLPLLATQLLWINLVTDTGPALAMGMDPPAADLMDRRPRKMGDRVIDARMWLDVFQVGAVTAVVTLLSMDLYLPGGLIDGSGDIVAARTVGFTTLVFASLFTCLHARSDTASAFSHLFENPWLWGAMGLSALLQGAVVNFGFLNVAFGTSPLTIEQWLVCVAMASAVLWSGELRKLVERALRRKLARPTFD
ncbi:MAG: cation-translocating P-type ATPase [Steroidobacteraceae bacterium]|nr:cation-translocating P-type ATPase [Steroidobacteraceae bacterium]